MSDYRLFQKENVTRAINVKQQDQQDALLAEGYAVVWDVVNADDANAAVLRYQQLRHEENNAPQTFATESVISNLLNVLSR